MMSVFGFERVTVLKVTLVAIAVTLAACLLTLVGKEKPAGAAFPGANGKIVFNSFRDGPGNGEVYVMDANGANQTRLTTTNPASEFDPVWSSDGSKIAFQSDRDGNPEVYVMDANGANQINLTTNPAIDWVPAWSPDGSKIVFTSDRDGAGNYEIYVMDANGANQTRLTTNPASDLDAAWSPYGSKIAFTSFRDGDTEIYVMDANGANQINLTNNPASEGDPVWSPDGSKIAFTSDRDGNLEIYVMDANGANQINLTTNPALDRAPAWSPDGSKIAFTSQRDGNREVYVMDANGANQINLTNNPAVDVDPDWQPLYNFSGFYQPVDNLDTNGNYIFNKTKPGKTIPIRFSLGGDKGLNIFDDSENPNPKSEPIDCKTGAPIDEIEQTVTGTSSLSYNAGSARYEYDWATISAWSGTCRQFVMKLKDGTVHRANFTFK
jgi:dipeptidyl aminopeptidase/acylaminoacyl peptidase